MQFKISLIYTNVPRPPATNQPLSINYPSSYCTLDISRLPDSSAFLQKDFSLICQHMTPIVVPMMTAKVQVLQIFRSSQEGLLFCQECDCLCDFWPFLLHHPSNLNQGGGWGSKRGLAVYPWALLLAIFNGFRLLPLFSVIKSHCA